MAVKVEKNLLALGKGDWIGSSRASNSKAKTKSRVMNSANLAPDAITKLTEVVEKIQIFVSRMKNEVI